MLPEEEDYLRAHYLYHNGIWERMEDIEAAQHHQDPDYPVSMWDYELAERNIRIYDPCYAATAILSESFEASNDQKLQKWCKIYKNI